MARGGNPWGHPWPIKEFDPRELVAGFESRRKARVESNERSSALLKSGSTHDRKLRRVLLGCKSGRRCLSPACPVCIRRYRGVTIGAALRFWRDFDALLFGTLIPPDAAVDPGGLHNVLPKRLEDRFRQQLTRLGITGPIIGWLDLDFDEERQVWQPHYHFIAPASARTELNALRRFYNRTDRVPIPLKLEAVKDRPWQISYCMKGYAARTLRYKCSSGRPFRDHTRPRGECFPEWLRWAAGYHFSEFLFLYRVRRYGIGFRTVLPLPARASDSAV